MYKKYKYIYLILIVVIVIILLSKVIYKNKINYKIKSDNKVFKINQLKTDSKYYIEISYNNKIYPLDIDYTSKKRKIIKDIYYFKDKKYECILPIFSNNSYIDMMCYKDKVIYNYSSIKGNDTKLDKYIKSIKIYDINKYKDNKTVENIVDGIKFYNNLDKNIYITNYRGITSKDKSIDLFNSDIYNKPLSVFINNYYLIADYNKLDRYEFNEFYLVNLDNYNTFKIKYKDNISFDSYIQGIVDNKIYLYDIDNEKQYEIDYNSKKIKLISNDKVKYYNNGKWENISISKANSKIYFNYESLDNIFDYDYVYETDTKYYLLKIDNDIYKLYLTYKQNTNIIKYLIDIETYDIIVNDTYLYYVYNDK